MVKKQKWKNRFTVVYSDSADSELKNDIVDFLDSVADVLGRFPYDGSNLIAFRAWKRHTTDLDFIDLVPYDDEVNLIEFCDVFKHTAMDPAPKKFRKWRPYTDRFQEATASNIGFIKDPPYRAVFVYRSSDAFLGGNILTYLELDKQLAKDK